MGIWKIPLGNNLKFVAITTESTSPNNISIAKGDGQPYFRNEWEKLQWEKGTAIIELFRGMNTNEAKAIISETLASIDKVSTVNL